MRNILSIQKDIDLDTGATIRELYLVNGKAHRDATEGPAVIRRDQMLDLEIVGYAQRGRLHRADGPAGIIRHVATGRVLREGYAWRGQWHREGRPALIYYDDQGRVTEERYYFHGMGHRDPNDGPAEIERQFQDGVEIVTWEAWRVFGDLYRDPAQGPHAIRREQNTGTVLETRYSRPNRPVPRDPHPHRRRVRPRTANP